MEKVEKIFRIKSQSIAGQLKELLAKMPLEQVQISNEIISYAKKTMKLKLNQSIYVTLTDHISFAISRCKGFILRMRCCGRLKDFIHRNLNSEDMR